MSNQLNRARQPLVCEMNNENNFKGLPMSLNITLNGNHTFRPQVLMDITSLFPIQKQWAGFDKPKQIGVDQLFIDSSNYNALLMGTTGSGMSILTNSITPLAMKVSALYCRIVTNQK